jgi:hypothetical protein
MSVAPVMDSFVLFGDSITQGGWESGAFAQKLAGTCLYYLMSVLCKQFTNTFALMQRFIVGR